MKNRPSPVLLGVLGVLLIVGAYLLLWKPRADDIADANAARDDARRELALVRGDANGTTTTTDPAVANALKAAVPATPALPDLLRQLKAIGADLDVQVQVITPTPTAALPNNLQGGVVAVAISGSGTASAVNTYVSRVSGLSRLFVVDKITMSAAPATGAGPDASATPAAGDVQLDLSGRVFTTGAPDATAAAPATTTAAPATTTTVTPASPATTAAANG